MFCKNCGKEVNENAVVCIHCGAAISNKPATQVTGLNGESKTALGVVLGLFLGLIGLIIGLCMFPSGSEERSTFLKGWGITFAISVILSIVLSITVCSSVLAGLSMY